MEAISIVGHGPPPSNRPHPEAHGPTRHAEEQAQDAVATPENTQKIASSVQALNLFHDDREHTRFQYRVHPEYGTLQVTLFNYMTGEIVQEIPSTKLLEFSKKMREMSGMLLEEQA